ncbi:MAG: transposase, partial [Planctomycetota bacterium]
MGRPELTNEQWRPIRDLFSRPATRRGKPRHPRRLLDGAFWILRTGAPWRGLPER